MDRRVGNYFFCRAFCARYCVSIDVRAQKPLACIIFGPFWLARFCRALLFLLPEEVGFLRYLRAAKVSFVCLDLEAFNEPTFDVVEFKHWSPMHEKHLVHRVSRDVTSAVHILYPKKCFVWCVTLETEKLVHAKYHACSLSGGAHPTPYPNRRD